MTRSTALVLVAAAAAAAAAAVLTEGGRVKVSAAARAAAALTGAQPQHYGPGHLHLCHPEDFAVAGTPMLRQRHPLFRRPAYVGEARHRAAVTGWAWYADPPSERGL